jgi:hypothetical protein
VAKKLDPFEWCEVFGFGKKISPVVKTMFVFFKDVIPKELTSNCLAENPNMKLGRVEIKDVSLYNKVLMFLPTGYFKFTEHWYDDKNETFLWFALTFKIDN